ncbi:MAG: stage II sporulation protein M [Chitinophagaceae bacterium]|nr:stage II sporulation protein M [Chitinophagaceae bacterium]
MGTLWIMFYNGVMVGAFEYMFFSKGLGWQSIMVIWIHGTMEIASIIISGSAGLVMGGGILFPGTYSRRESFKRSVKDALKIIISMVPFFIVAALLESYVTYLMSDTFVTGGSKGGGLPIWMGILILAISFAIMFWYFVWFPRQKALQPSHGLRQSEARIQSPEIL